MTIDAVFLILLIEQEQNLPNLKLKGRSRPLSDFFANVKKIMSHDEDWEPMDSFLG